MERYSLKLPWLGDDIVLKVSRDYGKDDELIMLLLKKIMEVCFMENQIDVVSSAS